MKGGQRKKLPSKETEEKWRQEARAALGVGGFKEEKQGTFHSIQVATEKPGR